MSEDTEIKEEEAKIAWPEAIVQITRTVCFAAVVIVFILYNLYR
jgi:preprotein translocase subunit SecE